MGKADDQRAAVQKLRETLGFSRPAFAEFLKSQGIDVGASTVEVWEKKIPDETCESLAKIALDRGLLRLAEEFQSLSTGAPVNQLIPAQETSETSDVRHIRLVIQKPIPGAAIVLNRILGSRNTGAIEAAAICLSAIERLIEGGRQSSVHKTKAPSGPGVPRASIDEVSRAVGMYERTAGTEPAAISAQGKSGPRSKRNRGTGGTA